ncbi:autotransporter assembly complex protein TamA [Oceaniglobus ichthyenteri]|uniref:autotransporter assembly complex protein TamA n=1 Tax=Oceaniglobus ichthyenteri TaxID=2136177 RepID=UPI001F0CA930|nr:autotransporter assembly complex family protein [Oceaniglobus ichthyenteri]
MISPSGLRIGAIFATCMFGTSVFAFDALKFNAPGADEALTKDLWAASLLVAAKSEGTTDPQELLAAARADYGRLVGALYAEGRFGGIINILVNGREAAGIPPLNPPSKIDSISVTIQPGPQYRFSETSVRPVAPDTEFPKDFTVGQPARTPLIRDGVAAAVVGWREVGRAKAAVSGQQVTADHDADQVRVRVAIAPGPVVTFGNLLLQGGDRVRPERLRKIAGLPTGETYSPAALETAAKRLRRTGVFKSVSLTEAENLGPGDTMDITAILNEEKPRRLGFGAEISTTDGAKLTGFWLHRNLLGGAERLRLEGEIGGLGGGTGGEDYKFAATYGRPATPDADTDLFVIAEIEQLNEPTYNTKTGRLGFGFMRYVNDDLTLEAGLGYVFSKDTDATGTTEYQHLTVPLGATYDTRDNVLDATKGVYADVDVMPFLGLSGTESGARLAFDARTYRGFGAEDKVVLAGRIQGGSVIGASLAGVPNDYRFYSGGGGTVRGQEYQSLGVTVNGNLTGGRSFLGLSGEVRAKVRESIGVVAFADFGLISADSFGSDGETHGGAGLGLRYLTPIGPIRLDVAAPIGGTSKGAQLYVGIGQAF